MTIADMLESTAYTKTASPLKQRRTHMRRKLFEFHASDGSYHISPRATNKHSSTCQPIDRAVSQTGRRIPRRSLRAPTCGRRVLRLVRTIRRSLSRNLMPPLRRHLTKGFSNLPHYVRAPTALRSRARSYLRYLPKLHLCLISRPLPATRCGLKLQASGRPWLPWPED